MNKKLKMLLFGGIAVVLLVAVMVVLLLTAPEEEVPEDTSSTAAESIAMVEKNLGDFESMTVKNPDGTFVVVADTVVVEATEEGAEDTETTNYVIDSLRDYNQNQTTVSSLVSSLVALSADSKVFDEVENKAEYGLDHPQATATIDLGSEKVVIHLGNQNEATQVFYAMVEGDDALYTVASTIGNKMLATPLSYLTKTLLPAYDMSTSPYVQLEYLEINRPDLDLPIILQEYSGIVDEALRSYMSGNELASPIKSEVNYHVDDEILPAFFGMAATSVVAEYDEADASTYGFDKPNMTVNLRYIDTDESKVTTSIVVGNMMESGNAYYVLHGDDGLVYEVAASSLGLITVTADDMITTLPLLPNITTIDNVELLLDGTTYTLGVESSVKDPDDEDSTLEVVGATVDGAEVDVSQFKQFYQLLLSVSVDKVNMDEKTTEPTMEITYHYTEGGSDSLSCYLLDNNRRVQILVNDTPLYEGRAGFVEKVRTELQHLINGETVDTDW